MARFFFPVGICWSEKLRCVVLLLAFGDEGDTGVYGHQARDLDEPSPLWAGTLGLAFKSKDPLEGSPLLPGLCG